jgi:hypothetical protein
MKRKYFSNDLFSSIKQYGGGCVYGCLIMGAIGFVPLLLFPITVLSTVSSIIE